MDAKSRSKSQAYVSFRSLDARRFHFFFLLFLPGAPFRAARWNTRLSFESSAERSLLFTRTPINLSEIRTVIPRPVLSSVRNPLPSVGRPDISREACRIASRDKMSDLSSRKRKRERRIKGQNEWQRRRGRIKRKEKRRGRGERNCTRKREREGEIGTVGWKPLCGIFWDCRPI